MPRASAISLEDPSQQHDRRARSRIVAGKLAAIYIEGRAETIEVVNISNDGCLIATSQGLALGQRIRLALPGVGETQATVAWSRGSSFGCLFDAPIADEYCVVQSNVISFPKTARPRVTATRRKVARLRRRNLTIVASSSVLLWAVPIALMHCLS